jgi:FKBP-type peptidyl-prolyl cis-trans isomerase FklB
MFTVLRAAIIIGLLCVPLAAQAPAPAKPTDLKTLRDKASYSIGLSIGERFASQLIDPNVQTLLRGIQDGLAGKKDLSDEQIKAVMEAYDKEITARLTERNQKEGAVFLAANKKKEGVKTTKSGLQYKILKAGKGTQRPGPDDLISAHYTGRLISGQEFDSSYRRREPLVIGVGGVIAGWTEALQLMTVGSKWQLVVPPELAYAADGFPPMIGPHATLVFELELLGVEKAEDVGATDLPAATDRPATKSARPANKTTRPQ